MTLKNLLFFLSCGIISASQAPCPILQNSFSFLLETFLKIFAHNHALMAGTKSFLHLYGPKIIISLRIRIFSISLILIKLQSFHLVVLPVSLKELYFDFDSRLIKMFSGDTFKTKFFTSTLY